MPTMSKVSQNALIFDHRGNARVATSVILVGILAIMTGELLMAFGLPVGQPPRLLPLASVNGADSTSVRFVGARPPINAACEQQVWPNIEQRCLARIEAKTATTNLAPTALPEQKTAPDDTLSPTPAPAVPVVAVEGQSTTQGEATNGTAQNVAPAPLPPEARRVEAQSEATVGSGADNDDTVDEPPDAQPSEHGRSMPHRPSQFHFHVHIRGFHF